MTGDGIVLVLNAGAPALKAAAFDGERRLMHCVIEGLGASLAARAKGATGEALAARSSIPRPPRPRCSPSWSRWFRSPRCTSRKLGADPGRAGA